MSYKLTRASSPVSDFQTHSCSWFAKVKDFSNERVHKPGEPAVLCDYSVIEGQSSEKFWLRLFANGITSDDKGYVAIVFYYVKYLLEPQAAVTSSLLLSPRYKHLEFSCVVSVIDSFENKRFSQSYVIPYNPHQDQPSENWVSTLTVDRLLKRDFLLSDRDDLLPGECLSLHIDVTIKGIRCKYDKSPLEVLRRSLAKEETDDGAKWYLRLDSELAAHLAKISAFFERVLETPTVKRRTRSMEIDEDEYRIFRDVCGIVILYDTTIIVPSVIHVCHMYILADMYLLPNAVEICRDLLTVFLREEKDPATMEHVRKNVPDLQELAELYDDAQLRQSIECYLTNGARSVPETDWKLRFYVVDNDAIHLSYFTFVRNVEETASHDFYQ